MRNTAVIALKLAENIPAAEADYFGADKGALACVRQGIRMKAAVGDFDSVSEEEKERIRLGADEMIRLNPDKNDSDSEAAVTYCLRKGYKKIILCGAFGGRIDHTYVNLRLAAKYPGIVEAADDQNRVTACGEGEWVFEADYPYLSLFAPQRAVVSLEGMKYPLRNREITSDDLYTLSNEVTGSRGKIIVHSGLVMVMQCRDK